jgi:hypothetical protein
MKRYADLITGTIGLVIGAALLVMSLQIGAQENDVIGAAFLPEIVSVIILGMAGKLALDGWKASRTYQEEPEEYQKNYLGVAVMIAASILYANLLKPVGFIVMSIPYLFLTLCMMSRKEETNYVKFAVITLVTVLVIWFVFTGFFSIRLPKGILSGIL